MSLPIRTVTVAVLCLAAAVHAESKDDEVARYIRNLKASEPAMRKSAAEGIGKVAQIKASAAKPALQPLIEALADPSPTVRAAVANTLAKLDEPKQVVPVLIKVVKEDTDNSVRMAAATGLGLIGEPAREAVPALRALMRDAKSDEQKRMARVAGEAIRQIMGTNRKKP
jgi:HEAT repeat protein